MDKERSKLSDGIKTATHMIEVAEILTAVHEMTAPKWRLLVDGVVEKVLMGLSIAAVCGLFWLMDLTLRALKN